MSIGETFRALDAEISGGDVEKAAAYLADDLMLVGATPQPLDKQAALGFWTNVRRALPDFSHNAADLIEREGQLYATVAVSGTHTGELRVPGFQPVPATGKRIQLPRENIEIHARGDKVTEWIVQEVPGGGMPGLLRQLGVELVAA